MFDKEYRPPNPGLQQKGTPITYTDMNQITGELGNIVTGLGGVLDVTKADQVLTSLTGHFAPLNSPTLTGIPLTSNPDGTVDNQIATVDYVNQKALQATVGFTPVQQSGGTDQGANKIYIGADSTDATQARIQIDQTDLGKIVFQQEDDKTYGVSKFGYNHENDELAFYDTGNKAWHFSYTTDQIDAKAYISSLPDGNNLKVSDIIWNSSSSLPALYYGTDNSVAYLATEAWADGQFLSLSNSETQTVEGPVTYKSQTSYENTLLVTGNEPTIHFTRSGVTQWDTWVGEDGTLYVRKFDADGNWIEDYSRFWPNGSIEFAKPVTLSGGALAPDITDFTGQSVLNADTAEKRYQPKLGFTPVQQGGGAGQGPNEVILGWATDGSGLKCQVDSTDEGFFSFRGEIECFAFGAITYNSSSVVASFSFLPSHDGYLKLDYNLGQASNNPVANLEVTGSGFNIIGGVDNNSGTNLRVGSSLYSVVAGQQVVVNMTGTYTASGSQTDVGGTAIYIPK
ncbi:tail fiber protein [Acetobacter orientalis]|uniref:Tail fiber protein n=1 Tax=Acetobacter orientalis TaxID=146474 RepID=A0A2Z5ZIR2_9PROT|nr:tail fiber protein [Acetobacter orientalis]